MDSRLTQDHTMLTQEVQHLSVAAGDTDSDMDFSDGAAHQELLLAKELELRIQVQLLNHSCYLCTGLQAGTFSDPGQARSWFGSISTLQQGLQSFGYELADPCVWRRVGVPKLDWPKPDEYWIRNRAKWGLDLLNFTTVAAWGKPAQSALERGRVRDTIKEVERACEARLQEVWQERKKLGVDKDGWALWQQLGSDLESWLLRPLPHNTHLLTKLSNVQHAR